VIFVAAENEYYINVRRVTEFFCGNCGFGQRREVVYFVLAMLQGLV
jgi:hypothetical protein